MAAFIIPPKELTFFFFPEIIAEQYCCHSGRLKKAYFSMQKGWEITWHGARSFEVLWIDVEQEHAALHICVRGSSPDKTLPSGKLQFFESTIQIGYTLACLHLENIWLDAQLCMYFLRAAGTVLAIRLGKCVDIECCL